MAPDPDTNFPVREKLTNPAKYLTGEAYPGKFEEEFMRSWIQMASYACEMSRKTATEWHLALKSALIWPSG